MGAANDLLSNYQHVIDELTFITSTGGTFEIRVNGDLIYSKKTMQKRHARPGEILELFRDIVGPDVPTYPQSD